MNVIRFVAALLVVSGLGALAVGTAGAVPKPQPRFWSVARCERVVLEGRPLIRQVSCVAGGGPADCRWATGRRARLYSQFTVFTRNRQRYVVGAGLEPGVVRSFTLATRARPGFVRMVHHFGDEYAGWPADFFMRHARLVATHVAPARFRSTVAPIATQLRQREKTINCTGR
ncbi:MAG TPA: hypothetical protein VGP69_02345 [Gaiellaceae bacterium]|jgi:hypothetical protein|nr:hypothetical protein [Gaiellaceae bacterium]